MTRTKIDLEEYLYNIDKCMGDHTMALLRSYTPGNPTEWYQRQILRIYNLCIAKSAEWQQIVDKEKGATQ